ncbi:hypothetical protein BGZ83_007729 [Gryganskiella cystojenkinii]|nr:hypothetical protein BGZ83_007729 [Gryganskiella cystojenkinii]
MSPPTVLPIPTKASTQDLAKAAACPAEDSTFELLYHQVNGRAELIRNLLAFADVEWQEIFLDWRAQKPLTPFNVAPVLYETTSVPSEADPSVPVILEIAESQAIERYLGQKFKLFGSNIWEEHLVNRYFQSIDGFAQYFSTQVVTATPGEARVEAATEFYTKALPKFARTHERHLRENGDNGHYVGDKYTLADFKLAQVLDRILLLVPEGLEVPISAKDTPSLWKVKETVAANPSVEKWKNSEKCLTLRANTKARFQSPPDS